MQIRKSRLTQVLVGAAFLAGAYCVPAAADVEHNNVHHHATHRPHHYVHSNDITVRARPHVAPVAAAPDAFHGPAAIVTAPVAIAGTIVSLPFRFVEAMFPPAANDPRVMIGAPVHLAEQIAEFPFYVVNSAFGAPATIN